MAFENKYWSFLTDKLSVLDQVPAQCPCIPINDIAQRLNVRPRYLVLSVCSVVLLSMMSLFGVAGFANVLTFGVPLYLMSRDVSSACSMSNAMWTSYWLLYSALAMVESLTDLLYLWIPAYP